jgi:hypothetical protein
MLYNRHIYRVLVGQALIRQLIDEDQLLEWYVKELGKKDSWVTELEALPFVSETVTFPDHWPTSCPYCHDDASIRYTYRSMGSVKILDGCKCLSCSTSISFKEK